MPHLFQDLSEGLDTKLNEILLLPSPELILILRHCILSRDDRDRDVGSRTPSEGDLCGESGAKPTVSWVGQPG